MNHGLQVRLVPGPRSLVCAGLWRRIAPVASVRLRCIASLWVALLYMAGGYLSAPAPALAADAIPGEEFCEKPVEATVGAIEFSGNEVTRRAVMLREVVQPLGGVCSLDLIIDSVQNLMDLGLFKRVYAEIQPRGDRVVVRFTVREKYFFLALPRLSRTSDRELRAGLQLRWDNFTGRLHQLKLTSELRKENDGEGETGYVHSLDYVVPRFFDSDYGLSLDLARIDRESTFESADIRYGNGEEVIRALGFSLARWFNRSGGVQGLRVFGGARHEERRYRIDEGTVGRSIEGRDMHLRFGFEHRTLHQDTYRRRGRVYGASFGASSALTGSDFDYHRLDIWAAWYRPLPGGFRNLNLQWRLGVSDGAPFGESGYEIGGGELMRGLEPGRHAGDMLALLNAEYLSAFFRYPDVRWVVFADLGNVYPKHAIDLFDQRLRVGGGVRWKVQALTNTDLRVDLAWNPDKERVKTYLSTSMTF